MPGFGKVSTFLIAFLWAWAACAAEFAQYAHGDAHGICQDLRTIAVTGELAPGDFERLNDMLPKGQLTDSDGHVPVERVTFEGTGGDYFEAVKIAHLLRGYHIQSYVPENARCEDACAVAFMGGTGIAMEGYFPPDRRIAEGAALKLTLPGFTDLRGKPGSLEEVATKARDNALQLFVRYLELAEEHEWSEESLRMLIEGGPGTTIDLATADIATKNQIRIGADCRVYRQESWNE